MSFKAMAWATEQEVTTTSTQSHLLLILASFANEVGECYPSISTMMAKTRLAEKTVRKCLKELMALGLISDTEKTAYFGAKIYQLNLDTPSKSDTPSKNAGGGNSTSTPLVDLPQGGGNFTADPLVNLPPNPVIEPVIEPVNNHKSVSTHEHTHENQDFQTQKNHGEKQTTLDNSKSKKNNSSDKKSKSELRLNPNGIEKPDELDSQIWLDFLKIKKQRTREDLSVTAWNRFINQVVLAQQKTNHSLDELFGYWIGETNWKGFNCDWYLQRQQPQNNFSQPNRMNELRQMANANPVTDVFIDDLPPQFYALGANHE